MAQPYVEQYNRMQTLSEQLGHESESVMSALYEFQERVMATGAVSKHVKQLMALAIAIVLRSNGSISIYVHDALKAGATRNEILETIGVAIFMGGFATESAGSEALQALNEL